MNHIISCSHLNMVPYLLHWSREPDLESAVTSQLRSRHTHQDECLELVNPKSQQYFNQGSYVGLNQMDQQSRCDVTSSPDHFWTSRERCHTLQSTSLHRIQSAKISYLPKSQLVGKSSLTYKLQRVIPLPLPPPPCMHSEIKQIYNNWQWTFPTTSH